MGSQPAGRARVRRGNVIALCLLVCGNASNEIHLLDRFIQFILLEIDESTMLERIDDDTRGNDFGRIGDTRALSIVNVGPA
jgi:hypothetical protein